MKLLSLPLLLALLLVGCSAEDLTGPEAFTDQPLQALASEARSDFGPVRFSIRGTWEATDAIGTVTLFMDDMALAPVLAGANAGTMITGKGTLNNYGAPAIDAAVHGRYTRDMIEVALMDADGEALAKGTGSFTKDLTGFKVLMTYATGRDRTLLFVRQ